MGNTGNPPATTAAGVKATDANGLLRPGFLSGPTSFASTPAGASILAEAVAKPAADPVKRLATVLGGGAGKDSLGA